MAQATLRLRPFDKLFAPVVAGWARNDDELFWLAPSTSPPLTARKVIGWTRPKDRPLLLFRDGESEPCGYGELNPLNNSHDHVWVGHVVLAPHLRGCGLGRKLADLLIREAFSDPRVQRLSMVVFPENTAAVRCYEAVGFRLTSREQHRFRPRRDVYTMLRLEVAREDLTSTENNSPAQ